MLAKLVQITPIPVGSMVDIIVELSYKSATPGEDA